MEWPRGIRQCPAPASCQVCTADGTCMDIVNAVPYIQKFRKHPVSGEPLELKDLIRCGLSVCLLKIGGAAVPLPAWPSR